MAPNNNGNQGEEMLKKLIETEGEMLIISPSIKEIINKLEIIASSIDNGNFPEDAKNSMLLLYGDGKKLSSIFTKIIDDINLLQKTCANGKTA